MTDTSADDSVMCTTCPICGRECGSFEATEDCCPDALRQWLLAP